MPVAVGTGGKTVAFRGVMSADQTGIPLRAWTKVNIDTIYTDDKGKKYGEDADFDSVNNRFKPSVAGYYQVSGTARQQCTPASSQTVVAIYKNGVNSVCGSEVVTTLESARSTASGLIYLDGKDDYISLHVLLNGTGTLAINNSLHNTSLSAVLVSGGSASGDSIWSDVDGDAVLETDGKKLTIDANVAELGAKARISTDTNLLEFNVGSGSLPKMSINNNGRVTLPVTPSLSTSAQQGNVYMNESGALYKSTATTYSAEEVDKKLAVMQKVIDKLEKKLK
jgi:hypothetical protein